MSSHTADRSATTVLVTGATGRQGGAVTARLLADGWRVRALTRDPEGPKAKALKEAGVEVVGGDLDDRDSLDRAAKGAWGAFSVHAGAYEGGPYDHDREHEARSAAKLAAAAKDAGVAHVVHSSAVGVGGPLEPAMDMLQHKGAAERALRESGLSLTILRPTAFMENAFDSIRELRNGALVSPLRADTYEPLIAAADIAAFAALAFADPERHRGKVYELAGDDLTQAEKAALIGRVTGREVPYVSIPIEQIAADSPSTATMIALINEHRMEVDIPALRAIHPGLLTFEQWMTGVGKPLVDAYFARIDAA
ncbi:NmrA family NAD(P)-binding protein [Glycomyces sp. TRM65418]|uniref:NmrA family NAD(P)-binding protein n=1 Tax=Glycomyces sp. TRM65418 TaxID=2867006 RepID=UPI001CE4E94D|nr:NmrA family NAD(P)-binding protein [Glycomyces sp. TRM65418]MCC3764428.1 NmrA family NAD(P)-binding protein [Glycomyces sp. TRM65418]QZD54103.1 NmrA family NAD(P)-binding protein [Glycomyces sp. TRM65418]